MGIEILYDFYVCSSKLKRRTDNDGKIHRKFVGKIESISIGNGYAINHMERNGIGHKSEK
jgi:hypothetical protein